MSWTIFFLEAKFDEIIVYCVSFQKTISCLKKSFEKTLAPIQRPAAEFGIWKG